MGIDNMEGKENSTLKSTFGLIILENIVQQLEWNKVLKVNV